MPIAATAGRAIDANDVTESGTTLVGICYRHCIRRAEPLFDQCHRMQFSASLHNCASNNANRAAICIRIEWTTDRLIVSIRTFHANFI